MTPIAEKIITLRREGMANIQIAESLNCPYQFVYKTVKKHAPELIGTPGRPAGSSDHAPRIRNNKPAVAQRDWPSLSLRLNPDVMEQVKDLGGVEWVRGLIVEAAQRVKGEVMAEVHGDGGGSNRGGGDGGGDVGDAGFEVDRVACIEEAMATVNSQPFRHALQPAGPYKDVQTAIKILTKAMSTHPHQPYRLSPGTIDNGGHGKWFLAPGDPTEPRPIAPDCQELPEHIKYRRIPHAGHYIYPRHDGSTGHDLEEWAVRVGRSGWNGGWNEARPVEVPRDAEKIRGWEARNEDGMIEQWVVWSRVAPLTPGKCEWCR